MRFVTAVARACQLQLPNKLNHTSLHRHDRVPQHRCHCIIADQVLGALLRHCVEGVGGQHHDVALHCPASRLGLNGVIMAAE